MPWRSRRRSPCRALRREGVQLVNPHPECLGEITVEYPYLQDRYEQFRAAMTDANLIDRRHAQLALFREAEKSYEVNTGERIAHWQRRLLARYARNLALADHGLMPGIFDLTIAARGVVDDNYAWEVWETAGRYPPQKTASDLKTVQISGEEVWLDTKRIRLRRRLPSVKRRLRPVGLKPRKKEKFPGEWASAVGWQQHLLLSARRSGHRGLRAFPEEEGQEHSIGRARAHGAVHHVAAGWHRSARDHSQLARGQDLRAAVSENLGRGRLGDRDLRRGSREPLQLT